VPAAPEVGELVRPELVALADCARLCASGAICDAKTLLALALVGLPLATLAPPAARALPAGDPPPGPARSLAHAP
jgi:hypothetical protein